MIASESLALLKALVNTNTATDHLDGLREARGILADAFQKIGLQAVEHRGANGRVVLSFEVKGAAPKLALIGHLDTVFPRSCAFQSLHETGDRLIGPGVIDMKGGIVLIYDLLRTLGRPESLKGIRVLINDDEEIGSPGTKDVLQKLSTGISYGLIYEPGLPGGELITSHAGLRWFKLSVKGRAAHAGLEPEKGLDACTELCSKVLRMKAFADSERRLMVSPGVIQGGTRPNVVCEDAHALIDVRFPSDAAIEEVTKSFERICSETAYPNPATGEKPHAKLEVIAQHPVMPAESTRVLFGFAEEVARELGQTIKGRHVGYVSDGNHLARDGMNLLVGLGPYGGGMHTDSEHLLLSSYPERLELNRRLIGKILTQ